VSDSKKLGSLWWKTSMDGSTFLTGIIGEQRVIILRTKEKRSPKSPDFQVYLSEPAPAASPVEA